MSETDNKALEAFTEYFVRNYPGPDTVIFDPKWHAPRIFSAAKAALNSETSALTEERDRLREALQKAETVIDLMAGVVAYDATMQGPKILGVNGSAARRASEAASNYLSSKDRVKL
jgi:hypothetical protein